MKKLDVISFVVVLLSIIPFIMLGLFFDKLPTEVPIHWSIDGTKEYGDKMALWFLAIVPLMTAILYYIFPKIDPKKKSYTKFQSSFVWMQIAVMLLFNGLMAVVIVDSIYPERLKVSMIVCMLISISFILMGNVIPKFRQNFFMGFRTPWTINNEFIWMKTHRLGGRMMFGAGIIGFIGALNPNDIWKMSFLLIPLLLAGFIPIIMSFIWYRQLCSNASKHIDN